MEQACILEDSNVMTAGEKSILLADDEKIFLLSVSEGLRMYMKSVNIYTADNGRSALDILKSCPIDLLVTDLNMPEMDGFGLLERKYAEFPDTKVLVFTACILPGYREMLKNYGVLDVLEKPLSFEELRSKVEHALWGLSGMDNQIQNEPGAFWGRGLS